MDRIGEYGCAVKFCWSSLTGSLDGVIMLLCYVIGQCRCRESIELARPWACAVKLPDVH